MVYFNSLEWDVNGSKSHFLLVISGIYLVLILERIHHSSKSDIFEVFKKKNHYNADVW